MGKTSKFTLPALKEELRAELPLELRNSRIVDAAITIAFEAHKGQVREHRDTSKAGIPYIVHPIGVAKLTIQHWNEAELPDTLEIVVAAALTHDTVEDSAIDFSELSKRTSERCASLVLSLSKPSVTKGASSEERNKRFLEQIREAGPTSVYIKLCDILHNLSRPSAMPFSLLDKTLRKASGPYMQLTQGFAFEERLNKLLQAQIDAGMAFLSQRDDKPIGYDPDDFSSFLTRQISLSRSKVLEKHDIVAGIQRIPGVTSCSIIPVHAAVESIFAKDGLELTPDQVSKIEIDLTSKNSYRPEPPLFTREQVKSLSFSRLIAVPLFNNLLVQDTPVIVITSNDKSAPGWLNDVTLRSVVALMSERLFAQHMNELNDLSDAVRHFALDLDPHVAREFNISIAQIPKIKAILEAANYVRRGILINIENLLKDSGLAEDVDRIESRTKRAEASLKKVKSRHSGGIEFLDDLVGIRLVTLTRNSKKALANLFLRWLSEPESLLSNSLAIIKGSISVEEIGSLAGYSATHIRFEIESPGKKFGKIGCEVQLRTLLEDAWARISQAMAYKQRLLSKSKTKKLLEDLAKLRDVSDTRLQEDL